MKLKSLSLLFAAGLLSIAFAEEKPSEELQACRKKVVEQVKAISDKCEKEKDWVVCLESAFEQDANFERDIGDLKKMGYSAVDAARRVAFELKRRDCSEHKKAE